MLKYELKHDSIAKLVYKKASEEDLMLRKVEKQIDDWYNYDQEKNGKGHLSAQNIRDIKPHLNLLTIDKKKVAFVQREIDRRKKIGWVKWIGLGLVVVAIGFATYYYVEDSRSKATLISNSNLNLQATIGEAQSHILEIDFIEAKNDLYRADSLYRVSNNKLIGDTSLLDTAKYWRRVAERKLMQKDSFDWYIKRAELFFSKGPAHFLEAIAYYEDAGELDYDTKKTKIEIDAIKRQFLFAIESLTNAGDTYFLNGRQEDKDLAMKKFDSALEICSKVDTSESGGPELRMTVDLLIKKIKECE